MPRRLVKIIFVFFVILHEGGAKSEQGLRQRSAVILAEKGYRLKDYVIQSIIATSPTDCIQHCLIDQRCKSLNCQSMFSISHSMVCELNNSTKTKNPHKLVKDLEYIYHDLHDPACKSVTSKCGKLPDPIYKSCSELKSKSNTESDGEYKLYLSFPSCNKAVNVYCADMRTSLPKEYITLKAGSQNNFSKKDYTGSSKENVAVSSKTIFSKIRINSDLSVVRSDFRFATVEWFHLKKELYGYGAAADCSKHSCSARQGKFKMDLTGTGLRFSTPINWVHGGFPKCQGIQPNSYSINDKKQIVSGNCGGSCGSCNAKDLKLELQEC